MNSEAPTYAHLTILKEGRTILKYSLVKKV